MQKAMVKSTVFSTRRVDEKIIVLSITGDIYSLLTDLDESEKLFTFLREAGKDENLFALIISVEKEVAGHNQYQSFINRMIKQSKKENQEELNMLCSDINRAREINILNRFISAIYLYKKITVIGFKGDVVTPFFGGSLAFDYRFVSRNSVVRFSHRKYGIHPSGALPYFLPLYLGYPISRDILISRKELSAEQLQNYNIAMLADDNKFDEYMIEYVSEMIRDSVKVCTLHSTKNLLNRDHEKLEEYFIKEAEFLGR